MTNLVENYSRHPHSVDGLVTDPDLARSLGHGEADLWRLLAIRKRGHLPGKPRMAARAFDRPIRIAAILASRALLWRSAHLTVEKICIQTELRESLLFEARRVLTYLRCNAEDPAILGCCMSLRKQRRLSPPSAFAVGSEQVRSVKLLLPGEQDSTFTGAGVYVLTNGLVDAYVGSGRFRRWQSSLHRHHNRHCAEFLAENDIFSFTVEFDNAASRDWVFNFERCLIRDLRPRFNDQIQS